MVNQTREHDKISSELISCQWKDRGTNQRYRYLTFCDNLKKNFTCRTGDIERHSLAKCDPFLEVSAGEIKLVYMAYSKFFLIYRKEDIVKCWSSIPSWLTSIS